jgi:hypothetical protein
MDSDYSANDAQQISLTVRFDNATHYSGTNDGNGRSTAINPFQDIISSAAGSSVGI